MNKFNITHRISGISYGDFEGSDESDAFDAMLADVGTNGVTDPEMEDFSIVKVVATVGDTTVRDDGTVRVWDCIREQWLVTDDVPDEVMATLSDAERSAIGYRDRF